MSAFLWPTRSQWRRWSLPARLTAIGAYVGLLGLFVTVGVVLIPKSPPSDSSSRLEVSARQNQGSNEPLYYSEASGVGGLRALLKNRTRVPAGSDMEKLFAVARARVPRGPDPALYNHLNLRDGFDLEAVNRRSAPGLTLEQFALNTKVSCYAESWAEDESSLFTYSAIARIPVIVPLWRPADCSNSVLERDPILDITVLNQTDQPLVVSSVEVLVTDADFAGGDIETSARPLIVPVAARYLVPLTIGRNEAWLQQLLPPLDVAPRSPRRFQFRLIPAGCIEGHCEFVSMYAILRLRLRVSGGRLLTTPQFQAVFGS